MHAIRYLMPLLAIALVTACGGGGGGQSAPTSAPAKPTTAPAAASPAAVASPSPASSPTTSAVAKPAGVASPSPSPSASPSAAGVIAELRDANNQVVGTAQFSEETGGGVRVRLDARSLPPGNHGIHIHEVARCDPPDFMTAGAHFNPTSRQHGLQNPNGHHAGDLPNLQVGADGTGRFDEVDRDVTLGSGTSTLFDADGSALVIHANPDDEMTDPSGNSGGRIACGTIRRA